jgi:alpha-galactosidase/6-phospho-beta-glucosidase family protein
MIGAGSIEFTRRLLRDILSVPELANTTFAKMDLSEQNLEMVTQLCRRDIAANGLRATIEATRDRRVAVADANFVICTIRQGDLPLGCAATCAASVRVQEMGMEAAVHGDLHLLKLAMLHDPLVGAVCNPEEVWQMSDELLVAQAEWLPQYASEIAPARQRLVEATERGARVQLRNTRGAARREVTT